MAMLSQEVNRLLGSALLDPALLKCILGYERARGLQGFNLQPAEHDAILKSHAHTLTELSRELTMVCGLRDVAADTDAVVDQFYQSARIGVRRTSIHMETVAQRIINSLPGQYGYQPSSAEGAATTVKYAEFQAVS